MPIIAELFGLADINAEPPLWCFLNQGVLNFRTEINKSVLKFRTLLSNLHKISTYSNPMDRKCSIGARPVIQ